MTIVFFLAQAIKNNSIVDVFWGIGFILISFFLQSKENEFVESQYFYQAKHLVNFFVFIWGFRLALYILIRNLGKTEDWRYQNFRKIWRKHNIPEWLGAYVQVFLLQGVLMFMVAIPIIYTNSSNHSINLLTISGAILWLIGFLFEAVGDYQLSEFKKNPDNKGKIMRYGLWKYTRHPNYFGEIVMWWGIGIMSVNISSYFSIIICLISPVTITWLLTKISGVPMLENKYKNDMEYQEYIKSTPAFFPKFRK